MLQEEHYISNLPVVQPTCRCEVRTPSWKVVKSNTQNNKKESWDNQSFEKSGKADVARKYCHFATFQDGVLPHSISAESGIKWTGFLVVKHTPYKIRFQFITMASSFGYRICRARLLLLFHASDVWNSRFLHQNIGWISCGNRLVRQNTKLNWTRGAYVLTRWDTKITMLF